MIELLVVIALLVVCVLFWKDCIADTYELGAWVMGLIGIALFSLFAFMIWGGTLIFCQNTGQGVEVKRDWQTQPIYSLRNTDGIEGRFTLGSGYVQTHEYYYMFGKQPDGGMYRMKLYANDCVLYQRNDTPHLDWQLITYRYPKWAHLWPNYIWTRDSKYNVIVPMNTIVEKFNIN